MIATKKERWETSIKLKMRIVMNRIKMLVLLLWTLTMIAPVGVYAQQTITHSERKPQSNQQRPKKKPLSNQRKESKESQKEKLTKTKSYEVSIICNEPNAFINIDDWQFGTGGGSWLLKEGLHEIRLSAEHCVSIIDKFTVGPDSRSFTFYLYPLVIQNLINNMVYVEGGTFMMGPPSNSHQVTVPSFSIGKYEVTQEEWQSVMGSNPSYWKINEEELNNPMTHAFFAYKNYPVESVSWDECQEFIQKLNSMTGKDFRMLTEAEWEFAARGGNKSRGYKYVGSNFLNDAVWFQENSDSHLHFVGQKTPNELGIYDMCGNVWEWCSGKYNFEEINGSEKEICTTGSSSGLYRVSRGCSFMTISQDCNAWARHGDKPNEHSPERGLRLAL